MASTQHFEPLHFSDLKAKIVGKTPLFGALFVFSFFSFTFLFIYFLYICTQRRHIDMIGGGRRNSSSPPVQVAGLGPATISGLPIFSFGSSHKKSSPTAECAICLSLFQEGEKVKVLPLCSHGFHSDCVDEWLKTRSSCPLCRASIRPIDSLGHELASEFP